MFEVDGLILVSAVMVLFAITSSKFSARIGLPVLVIFIALGMIAGSEGLGGIEFENYTLAHGIGTVALALILFDGGLRTSTASLRLAWKPSLALATAGVLITSLVTGLAAHWVLGISLLEGFLLGSIVGSTDAAAVFSVLRGRGAQLDDRLGATLEVESGSNDPMAIFLTIGILAILMGKGARAPAPLAVRRTDDGGHAGRHPDRTGGRVGEQPDQPGRCRALPGAHGGHRIPVVRRGGVARRQRVPGGVRGGDRPGQQQDRVPAGHLPLHRWHGVARPDRHVHHAGPAQLSEPAHRRRAGSPRDRGGADPRRPAPLRGHAAPVLPVQSPRDHSRGVGRSQGSRPDHPGDLPAPGGAAQRAPAVQRGVLRRPRVGGHPGVDPPPGRRATGRHAGIGSGAPISLEITSLRHVSGDIVDYLVVAGSRAVGRPIRSLALPDGAVVAMVSRGADIIPPRGSTELAEDDHVFLVVRPAVRPLVDRVFAPGALIDEEPLPPLEFPLSARMRVSELVEFYGIEVDAPPHSTLDELLRSRTDQRTPRIGTEVELGGVRLRVRELSSEGVEVVGLRIVAPDVGAS